MLAGSVWNAGPSGLAWQQLLIMRYTQNQSCAQYSRPATQTFSRTWNSFTNAIWNASLPTQTTFGNSSIKTHWKLFQSCCFDNKHLTKKCVSVYVAVILLPTLCAVQQAPVCAHRPDELLVQRCASGDGGHTSNLRQIPWEEGWAEGAVWERTSERLLPGQVLGESIWAAGPRRIC